MPFATLRIVSPSSLALPLLLVGLLVAAPVSSAQDDPKAPPPPSAEVVIGGVVSALERGSVGDLLDHATRRIEIVLLGQSALYSRGQAALVLRDFFRRHPADRVQLSERAIGDEGRAAMGRYWPENGSGPFALYVGFSTGRDQVLNLEVIRIERATFQRAGSR